MSEAAEIKMSADPILIEAENDNCVIDIRNLLKMPLILSEVLKNLPLEDLEDCRLVSNFWRSVATPIFKRRTKICLYVEDTGEVCEPFSEKLARYIVEMKDFEHHNYDLGNYDAEDYPDEDVDDSFGHYNLLLEDFFPHFGHQVEFLKFNFYITKIEDFEIFQKIVNYVPNLKELDILIEFSRTSEIVCEFSDLTASLKSLEKVHKLKLEIDEKKMRTVEEEVEEEKMLQVLSKFVVKLFPMPTALVLNLNSITERVLAEYANAAKVKECKISEINITNISNCPNATLLNLYNWPTPINKFHYSGSGELHPMDLQSLLTKLAPSLQDISICIGPYRDMQKRQKIILPNFPKLCKLMIKCSSYRSSRKIDFKFNSAFEQKYPILKKEGKKYGQLFYILQFIFLDTSESESSESESE